MSAKCTIDNVKLREFRQEDIGEMVNVLAQTWDFGDFADEKGLRACQQSYLFKNAHDATEVIVAECDGVLLGYLFGRIPRRALHSLNEFFKKSYANALKDWEVFATPEERQKFEDDWMWVQKWYAEQYLALGVTAQRASHVDLFMVSSSARGLGVGTKIFREFQGRHLKYNAGQNVLLQTDTWCGWRFYEKQGFRRLATCPAFSDAAQTDNTEQAYFIYGKKF